MKQVVQAASGGAVRVEDVPHPTIGPTEVLVETAFSVISPGTEASMTRLARSSLLAKARARPDLVRQVINRARNEGIQSTIQAVKARLDDDIPLGYSAAGTVLEVGEAVTGIRPGQSVATGGAGKANHAELQAVPGMLAAPVPEGVPLQDAAFATIGSIALHGLRLADLQPGSRVVIIGLGLLGQIAARLAAAAGYLVFGIDVADYPVERARSSGFTAVREAGSDTSDEVIAWSRGQGADAILVTAATKSSDIVMRAPDLSRDRGTIVIVGDVGLSLERAPFYDKELSLRFARSYGPGRYERSYEDWGVDYPLGSERWTEGRNMEAFLDLLAASKLEVSDLVTHVFDIKDAPAAYTLVETRKEPFLGIQLRYSETPPERIRSEASRPAPNTGELRIGLIGAGLFTRSVLVPAIKESALGSLLSVTSSSGLTAKHLADKAGILRAVSGPDEIFEDPEVELVVITTPHDSHAELTTAALNANKHVFCEKPLALTDDELDHVEEAWVRSGKALAVGFNRRWAEPVRKLRDHFTSGSGPLVITYRVSAGRVAPNHWYNDRRHGGRLLGEVCHFIDTANFIAGSSVLDIRAMSSGDSETLLNDDLVVSIQYLDGSLAVISYASHGHRSTEKERIEVLGRGRSACLIDFTSLVLDGSKAKQVRKDKGHVSEMIALKGGIRDGTIPTEEYISSMRATIRAAASLLSG